MGVRGLNAFIHKYPVHLLEEYEINNSNVVIDGSELVYYLYFDCGNFDARCGGEYSELCRITRDFISTLEQCDVNVFVVFDDFKSEKNISRYLSTKAEKLAAVRGLVDHGVSPGSPEVKLRPLMGKYVVMQTLDELRVPFVIIPGDGDAHLAAIANKLDAAVLATDTDFCIFDLKMGFLPMSDLRWQEVRENQRNGCWGKIFRRGILQEKFGTPLRSVAILEPLMSIQDGLQRVDFTNFLDTLAREVQIPRRFPWGKFRRPNRIESVLLWLRYRYRDDDQIISLIRQTVPDLPVDRFKECLRTYEELPDVGNYLEALRADREDEAWSTELSCFNDVEDLSIPASFLPVVPDDQDQPSSHLIASKIREVIYKIGFIKNHRCDGADNPESPELLETDRIGYKYQSIVKTLEVDEESMRALRLESDDIVERDDYAEIMYARKQFLMGAMLLSGDDLEIDLIEKEYQLLALSLKYWSSELEQATPDEVRMALAFTITFISHAEESQPLPNGMRPDSSFDKGALHFSTQWQICLCEATRLNSFLERPFTPPRVGKLFSGKIFQKAHHFFVSNENLAVGDLKATLFGGDQVGAEFFDRMLELVM